MTIETETLIQFHRDSTHELLELIKEDHTKLKEVEARDLLDYLAIMGVQLVPSMKVDPFDLSTKGISIASAAYFAELQQWAK
jgi:hypothetical protein